MNEMMAADLALAVKAMFYTTTLAIALAGILGMLYGTVRPRLRAAMKKAQKLAEANLMGARRILELERQVEQMRQQTTDAQMLAGKESLERARSQAIRKKTEDRLIAQNDQLAQLKKRAPTLRQVV